jgi:hypothetical protein
MLSRSREKNNGYAIEKRSKYLLVKMSTNVEMKPMEKIQNVFSFEMKIRAQC